MSAGSFAVRAKFIQSRSAAAISCHAVTSRLRPGPPRDATSWIALAQRLEAGGYDALLAADHPGTTASPFVALAAAAAVTERIGVGSYISQAGVREPLLLALDVATLDLVSNGRARLALGAAHTPAEWDMLGAERPDVAGRVRRIQAVAEACRALLAGETVTIDGPEVRTCHARLTTPRPVQHRVPFTFGGGNTAIVRWAGSHADVVGLSGLGRTLPDGYMHEVRWNGTDIDRQVDLIEQGASGRVHAPAREAFVQMVEVTDDAEYGTRDCPATSLRRGRGARLSLRVDRHGGGDQSRDGRP